MALFNDLGKKLTAVGQGAAQQTKIFAETTKINSHISDEERQIKNLYMEIGKRYVEANKNNPSAEYYDLIVGIQDADARIAQYKQQINEIKGVKKCPNCGAELANAAIFCNSCGTKIAEQPVSDIPAPMDAPVAAPVDTAIPTPVGTTIPTPVNTAIPTPVNTEVPTPVNTNPAPISIEKKD